LLFFQFRVFLRLVTRLTRVLMLVVIAFLFHSALVAHGRFALPYLSVIRIGVRHIPRAFPARTEAKITNTRTAAFRERHQRREPFTCGADAKDNVNRLAVRPALRWAAAVSHQRAVPSQNTRRTSCIRSAAGRRQVRLQRPPQAADGVLRQSPRLWL
jgi:hypothetical protein